MDISVRDTRIESFYPELKRIGFDGVDVNFPSWEQREYILSENFEEKIMESYKHIIDAELKVSQTHLTYYPGHYPPLGDGSYKAFEDYMLPVFEREIELVSKMNCKIAVIHLYFDESRESSRAGNLQLIEKLLPAAEKNNVILSIENIFGAHHSDVHLSNAVIRFDFIMVSSCDLLSGLLSSLSVATIATMRFLRPMIIDSRT